MLQEGQKTFQTVTGGHVTVIPFSSLKPAVTQLFY